MVGGGVDTVALTKGLLRACYKVPKLLAVDGPKLFDASYGKSLTYIPFSFIAAYGKRTKP